MILSRIPLMSYAIFLAVVANTISLAQAQAPPPPGKFTPVFGYGAIANANSDIPTGVPMSETDFNAIWKTSPNEILYRHCEDCPPSHKDIYMRRTGDTDKNLPFDMLTMVLQDWFEDPKNYLGINFDLYDTYEDALAQTDKWTFCNFDDAGIGFPRDCGKGGKHDGTWNSINRDTGAIYRGGQLNFFFAVETNAILTSDGGAGGDPHFKTFNRNFFSFHGACDLVLMQSKKFASGLGIAIHVRTSRVDSPRISYSYISSAAVKIGEHILEISDDGELLVNGDKASDEPSSFAGYSLARNIKGSKGRILAYSLYLGASKIITIRANTKTGMVYVDIDGYFGDSEGLLGAPAGAESESMGLLARDGELDLTGHWNTFGEEWQVRDTDPMLFKERRAPQYPAGCVYEAPKADPKAKYVRRRLMEDATGVSRDVATAACANLAAGQKQEFCIADVMATGDLELAEDPFYN